jgi:hypothetical protein
LTVERPQGGEHSLAPAGRGVAVVAENLELTLDVAGQRAEIRGAGLGILRLGAATGLLLELLLQFRRGDYLQYALLAQIAHHLPSREPRWGHPKSLLLRDD